MVITASNRCLVAREASTATTSGRRTNRYTLPGAPIRQYSLVDSDQSFLFFWRLAGSIIKMAALPKKNKKMSKWLLPLGQRREWFSVGLESRSHHPKFDEVQVPQRGNGTG